MQTCYIKRRGGVTVRIKKELSVCWKKKVRVKQRSENQEGRRKKNNTEGKRGRRGKISEDSKWDKEEAQYTCTIFCCLQ